jgi:hypothetical protein
MVGGSFCFFFQVNRIFAGFRTCLTFLSLFIISVASRFGMKVYVDSRRYRILSAFQWPKEKMKLLTTRKEEASIWVVPLGDINFKKIPEYLSDANNKPFSFPYKRVVGYRPTGWSMGGKPGSNIISTRRSGNHAVHSVPYSEHSSFPEVCIFNNFFWVRVMLNPSISPCVVTGLPGVLEAPPYNSHRICIQER